jgi:MPBQ/MSBQ methyltransferase
MLGARRPEVTAGRQVGWSPENLRHALGMLKYGSNPAATVYDSIGDDFFLALAPGWLNLGLWQGDGSDPAEGLIAPRRLIEHLAGDLPKGGRILDVGNGLAEQDPVISEVARPRSLTALNITLSQLERGRSRLLEARASAINGDATRMPLRAECFDGVICVEAAFHFPSRAAFFSECSRVLRPGGVLTMSDIPVTRMPRGPAEGLASVSQLRAWGLRRHAAATAIDIQALVAGAGFTGIRVEMVGERVIGPALRFVRERLDQRKALVPRSYEFALRFMLAQVDLLWQRRMVDYMLLRAEKPEPVARVSRARG